MDRKTAIYRFCNYQERCHQEVKSRLYELGSYPDEVNRLLAELIEADLLNEERFARVYVHGKFNLKRWGRVKITHELKARQISEYLIKKALKEIKPDDYFGTALQLAEDKWNALAREKDGYIKRGKVYRYLQQKGYESSIISEVIRTISTME